MAQKTPPVNDDDPIQAEDTQTDAPQETVEDAEIVDETTSDAGERTDYPVSEVGEDAPSGEAAEEPAREAEPEPVQQSAPEPQTNSPLFPMVLGGAVAAVLGGAVVYFMQPSPQPVTAPDSALIERIEALEAAPAQDMPTVDDVISAEEQAAFDALSGELTGLAEMIEALDARLTQLAEDGVTVVSGEDSAAVTAELTQMRDALEDQRAATQAAQAEMAEVAAAARAEIEAAEARAAELQSAADAQATQSARQSAIARIVAASETGAPFADPLGALAGLGADVSGLEAVAGTGIPSLPALQRSFPDAARDGLAASVKDTMGEGVGDRLGAFFRAQVGARSLEAREGDDPDAVLSRAEAALRSGDIAGVLTELSALPEGGQAAMAGWTTQAQTRIEALAALATLTASGNE